LFISPNLFVQGLHQSDTLSKKGNSLMQAPMVSVGAFFLLFATAVQAGPLHDAIKAGDLVSARSLVAEGADIDELDFSTGTPLHIASVKGEFDIVEMLLDAGADINSEEYSKSETPLHWAALGGTARIIERLVIAGAEIDARNGFQNTPLLIAVDFGHAEAARQLIELGADITARDQEDRTVMHLAGTRQLFGIVELLIAMGAQLPPPDKIEPLLQSASPEKGEKLFSSNCIRCHALPGNNQNRVGPSLWNVVGRRQSARDDFEYSATFSRLDGTWSFQNLNMLLLDAGNYYPGNAMTKIYRTDILEPQDRADMISFLRLQSNEPVPLP
jgi:ankyrin repeat protein